MIVVERRRINRRDGDFHAPQPRVAFQRSDVERHVPHAESGVPAFVGVGVRSAPVLLEEHPQPTLGWTEVGFGVQRSQQVILRDLLVEAPGELGERRCATDLVVEGRRTWYRFLGVGFAHRSHSVTAPGNSPPAPGCARRRGCWLPAVHLIDLRRHAELACSTRSDVFPWWRCEGIREFIEPRVATQGGGQDVHVATWERSVWSKQRVLLLNATYEPLTVVSIRRAVVLVLRERAEIIHAEDDANAVLHSVDVELPAPSVIRLRRYVRVPYRAVIPMTRAALMYRDQSRCAYCGAKATTIDHIVPRSRGGANTWDNCVACCIGCNHRKADRLLSELGWRLSVTPSAPRGRHWRLIASIKDIDPAWEPYIGAGAA